MKRSAAVLLFAALLLTATGAWAIRPHPVYHYQPTVYLTPGLGFISFSDNFEAYTGLDQVSDGIIGIDLSFRVVERLGVGFEVADVPIARFDRMNIRRGGDVIFLNFNIFYDIPARSNVFPFVNMGIGRMEIQDPLTADYGYSTYFFGGGVKARIHRNAGLELSVRHMRTFLDADIFYNTQIRGGVSFIF